MGINECSKPASKSSWDSQDFGDVNMVLKMVHFRKSSRPQWVNQCAQWSFISSGVWHFTKLTGAYTLKNYFFSALEVNFLKKLPQLSW